MQASNDSSLLLHTTSGKIQEVQGRKNKQLITVKEKRWKGKERKGRVKNVPATQHSAVVHVAAPHVFELGLFINTCGDTHPAKPVHVGAEKKQRNLKRKQIILCFKKTFKY